MSYEFKYLFTPLQIRHVTLRNRIVSTAHVPGYAENGMPGDRLRLYHAEKAKGGAGLICCFGSASVHPTSPAADWGGVELFDDKVIPYLKKFSDTIHGYGASVISQITHRGRRGRSDDTWQPLLAPSAIPEPLHREIPHQLDMEDFDWIIEAYGAAALRLKKGGFDGCEISAAHCHLIDQFWTPNANQRDDEYGGSLENRMRFSLRVIAHVREVVGDNFIVGLRMTGDDFVEGGLNMDITQEIAKRLNETGHLDYFNVIGGSGETEMTEAMCVPSMNFPIGCYTYLAAHIREVVNVPVIAVGRIIDPIQADKILEEGQADLVAMTRALIADPHLPNKAREGRLDDIRQCMGYNGGCIDRLYAGKAINCVQNAVIGREAELAEIQPAKIRKKVVVIGGGCAGMEAARTAKLRGHDVVLFEKTGELGGQILIAKRAPHRIEFEGSARWLSLQVRKLGIDLRLHTEASIDLVLSENPDAVIVATGSTAFLPNIPGATDGRLVHVRDVLTEQVEVGDRVLVVDHENFYQGISAAEFLLDRGREVEIITELLVVAQDLGETSRPPIFQRLFSKGIKMTPHTAIKEIQNGTVVVKNVYSHEERVIEGIDTVVYAHAGRAVADLFYALKGKVSELYLIGDSFAPRSLHHAILEGTRVARKI